MEYLKPEICRKSVAGGPRAVLPKISGSSFLLPSAPPAHTAVGNSYTYAPPRLPVHSESYYILPSIQYRYWNELFTAYYRKASEIIIR